MIAAQDQPPTWQPARADDALDEGAKSRGIQASIAALLVHLVAGGLDQKRRAVGQRLVGAGFQHQRVGRAY
jgi:hypothetical protein